MRPRNVYEHEGFYGTLPQIIERTQCPLPEALVYARLQRGWSLKEALTLPRCEGSHEGRHMRSLGHYKHRRYTFGVYHGAVPFLARKLGVVNPDTAAWRVRAGWPLERALLEPANTGKRTPLLKKPVDKPLVKA